MYVSFWLRFRRLSLSNKIDHSLLTRRKGKLLTTLRYPMGHFAKLFVETRPDCMSG